MSPTDPLLQAGVFVASLVANLLSALAGGGAGLVQGANSRRAGW